MKKFLAIVKREYVQRLRSRMFVLITVLGPVMISLFGIAPALVLRIKAGGPVKIATMAGQAAERGIDWLIQLAALLSIGIGILNLLPITKQNSFCVNYILGFCAAFDD